jgi:hypothetical protein
MIDRSTEHETTQQKEEDHRGLARHAVDIFIPRNPVKAIEGVVQTDTESGNTP